MDTKYKARLTAAYFIFAGACTLLLAWGQGLNQSSSGPAIFSISIALLMTGLYNFSLPNTPSKALPLITLSVIAATTLTDLGLPTILAAHWAYILPLYLFSLLPFRSALSLTLGYAMIFNLSATVQLSGIERLQVLYLFWSATSVACIFIFVNREKQQNLQLLVSLDAESSAYNTQQLLDDLPRELARADRENTSLALLCFKGRQEFPELSIRKSAQLLHETLRPFDRLYRVNDYLIALTPSGSFRDSVSICYQYYNLINDRMHLAAVIPGEHETEQELLTKAEKAIAFASRQDTSAPLYLKSDFIDIQNERELHD